MRSSIGSLLWVLISSFRLRAEPLLETMGAGKQWTAIENLVCVKVFVQTSKDPEKGAGMKKQVFETKMINHYIKFCAELMRSAHYSS